LKGGMPLYKFWGNKVLTFLQNRLLNTHFSEFHSGYRVYAVPMLARIPFEHNSNDFHFDTQIIIQLLAIQATIVEIPIPTYYGDEICYVNGLQYAWNVLKTTLAYRLQQGGIFYQRIYDVFPATKYSPKLAYASSHSYAIAAISPGTTVSDIACGPGAVAKILQTEKQCVIYGVDICRPEDCSPFQTFSQCDLDRKPLPEHVAESDYVLLLDIIEHLKEPEQFLQQLRATCTPLRTTILCSVPNIAFFPIRLMLLFGQFNYGKEGILDKTHTRLLTFRSVARLFQEQGFQIEEITGVPAPFPKAFGPGWLSQALLRLNQLAIYLRKELFAYQIFVRAHPLPTCQFLLRQSMEFSAAQEQASNNRPGANGVNVGETT
jgi:2-polyprenyl-3-methyl-5-hydroxy-6-metoxy-1,4-benzoquinol methylase